MAKRERETAAVPGPAVAVTELAEGTPGVVKVRGADGEERLVDTKPTGRMDEGLLEALERPVAAPTGTRDATIDITDAQIERALAAFRQHHGFQQPVKAMCAAIQAAMGA